MKQPGMTLRELLAGLVIGALIIGVTTNIFYQLNRTLKSIETTADLDQTSVVTLHQIFYDLQGAYMPALRVPPKVEGPLPAGTEQPKPKPVEKAFFATEKNKKFN